MTSWQHSLSGHLTSCSPPLDLNDWIARSYMRAMVRAQLLRRMAHRSRVQQKRRPRTTPLP